MTRLNGFKFGQGQLVASIVSVCSHDDFCLERFEFEKYEKKLIWVVLNFSSLVATYLAATSEFFLVNILLIMKPELENLRIGS